MSTRPEKIHEWVTRGEAFRSSLRPEESETTKTVRTDQENEHLIEMLDEAAIRIEQALFDVDYPRHPGANWSIKNELRDIRHYLSVMKEEVKSGSLRIYKPE